MPTIKKIPPTGFHAALLRPPHTHSAVHKKYSTHSLRQSDTRAAKARQGRAKFFIFLSSQSDTRDKSSFLTDHSTK
jgi:hypothetical protein